MWLTSDFCHSAAFLSTLCRINVLNNNNSKSNNLYRSFMQFYRILMIFLLQPEGDSALHKKRERTVIVKEMISKRLKQADVMTYKS